MVEKGLEDLGYEGRTLRLPLDSIKKGSRSSLKSFVPLKGMATNWECVEFGALS